MKRAPNIHWIRSRVRLTAGSHEVAETRNPPFAKIKLPSLSPHPVNLFTELSRPTHLQNFVSFVRQKLMEVYQLLIPPTDLFILYRLLMSAQKNKENI
jgi:hypothetical protein